MGDCSMSAPVVNLGSLLTTVEQLDALPELAVVVGDPEGQHQNEDRRRLAMQKRQLGMDGTWWNLADFSEFSWTSAEVVHRLEAGPILVIWLPASEVL